ncbi:MAG TPA: hypothetical protein VGB65_13305 [Allosphingosinicella sp.]|jgi:hypothetical protein
MHIGKLLLASSALTAIIAVASCKHRPDSEVVVDEATQAGIGDDRFVHAGEDYFREMDGRVALTPDEVKGRNMWIVWSGGNDRFWDQMGKPTLGAFDLLKIVAPPLDSPLRRATRWQWLGAVNEPCFKASDQPDPERFGLYLDVRDPSCPADPFADESKYPGVKIGARGTRLPDGRVLPIGSYYGAPTGIVGLRLFPNPAFDEAAAKAWDPARYYNDPAYYTNPKLVRPYRVGMSCGFCHVGPSPTNPPADPENPKWENLSSTVGAQYLWADRFFFWKPNENNFVYQWVHTFRPGALDTSLVSTDNINNPRTQNAIYNLKERLEMSRPIGEEKLAGGGLNNKQFNDFIKDGWLAGFFRKPDTVFTPHVLKDGADSVGAIGALNRVHINIGLFSEEWLRHFNPVMGGKPVSPIAIADAQKNSAYWRATEKGTPATALFFLKASGPHRLQDAPGGAALAAAPPALLQQGASAFARTCARCHSSKQPARRPANVTFENGAGYLASFRRWWSWTQTDDYKNQMVQIVRDPNFRNANYLSTDARVPVSLLRTNLCSPLATNGIGGNIWDNFSSETYKQLTPVGTVHFVDPFSGNRVAYRMPGGGRGYTRVPTLASLWSTAPYLLNNSLGPFNGSPSVPARLQSFEASINQLLFPDTRPFDAELGRGAEGWIDRTTARSYLFIPRSFLQSMPPQLSEEDRGILRKLVDREGNLRLGPIPAGMPINLLANLQPLAESRDPKAVAAHFHYLLAALFQLKKGLIATQGRDLTDVQLRQAFAGLREPLMRLSKCPDFVVNRGHYFGTAQFNQGVTPDERSWGTEAPLSDPDKRALIAFLKTL